MTSSIPKSTVASHESRVVAHPTTRHRCVFLDRDGVLIEDRHLLTTREEMVILPGVPAALQRLKSLGFLLVVVTNQPVIARGLLTEVELVTLHRAMDLQCTALGAPPLNAVYFCPHHPQATLDHYRLECDCRKPRPGMLIQAARDLNVDLRSSFLVGDRLSDIAAGTGAGCRTVLVCGPMTSQPAIRSPDAIDPSLRADHTCDSLLAASNWIAEAL